MPKIAKTGAATTPVSCVGCRKRKIKCSYGTPCQQCMTKGIDCAYRDRLKSGFRKGQFKDMTMRLEVLENENSALRAASIASGSSILPPADTVMYLTDVFLKATSLSPITGDLDVDDVTTHAIVSFTLGRLKYSRFDISMLPMPQSVEFYIEECSKFVYLECMRETSLDGITALLIMSFSTLLDGKGPSKWSCISLLTGTVNFVSSGSRRGTNEENFSQLPTPMFPSVSHADDERRCLIFWSTFCVKSLICYATGVCWTFSLISTTTNEVKWSVKALEEDECQAPEHNTTLSNLIDIMKVGNSVHTLLTQDLDVNNVQDVEKWTNQHTLLGAYLEHLSPVRPMLDNEYEMVIYAIYHAIIIRLHSPKVHTTNTLLKSTYSETKCRESIYALAELSSRINERFKVGIGLEEAIRLSNIYITFGVWVAGRNFFFLEEDMPVEFYVIVQSLRNLEGCCQLAGTYANILDRVNLSNSPRVAASEILPIRRTTFDIVSRGLLNFDLQEQWKSQLELLFDPIWVDNC